MADEEMAFGERTYDGYVERKKIKVWRWNDIYKHTSSPNQMSIPLPTIYKIIDGIYTNHDDYVKVRVTVKPI